jgi:hypothetical protein
VGFTDQTDVVELEIEIEVVNDATP